MVQTKTIARLKITHQNINEPIDMAGCFKDSLWRQYGTIDFEHSIGMHEPVAPCCQQIAQQGTAHRTEIILTSYTAIYGETLIVEKSAPQQIFKTESIESDHLKTDIDFCTIIIVDHLSSQ